MHPIVRDEVYLIGYEAIRNAYMHSAGSRLHVELTYGDYFSLRIRDNGSGIDPSIAVSGKAGHFGVPRCASEQHASERDLPSRLPRTQEPR